MQKPDKIYLENTNLSYTLKSKADAGTLRETFILNQLKNSGKKTYLPDEDDIIVYDLRHYYTFEIRAKSKSIKQIKNKPNSFIIADDIETGYLNKIPLYLFGFFFYYKMQEVSPSECSFRPTVAKIFR